MRVATAQYALTPVASFDGFARQCEGVVAQAQELGAQLLVLPEYLGGQILSALPPGTNAKDLADEVDRYRALFAQLVQRYRLTVLAGTTLVRDGERVRNTAHLFHADGRFEMQEKLHLTPWERDWGLDAGDTLRLVEIGGRKAAILICYDIEFPELARKARALGAELILCPSCTDDRHGFHRVRYCAQARAIEDQAFVVVSATVGALPLVDGLRQHVGQAALIAPCDYPFPSGGVLAEGEFQHAMIVVANLDFAALARLREGGSVRTWQDRRPEIY
jgi:predicted amidohydrolase